METLKAVTAEIHLSGNGSLTTDETTVFRRYFGPTRHDTVLKMVYNTVAVGEDRGTVTVRFCLLSLPPLLSVAPPGTSHTANRS